MIKTKKMYHAAFVNSYDIDFLKAQIIKAVRPNNDIDHNNYYLLENVIVKPGKQIFILKNMKTGKMKRSKRIYA